MKLKEFSLATLIAVGSSQAQVGIGTKTPQSKLDVKGDIKIGNEGKTDAQGKEGMVRWNKEKSCLECHDGEIWRCLEYRFVDDRSQDESIKTDRNLKDDAQVENDILRHAHTIDEHSRTQRDCPECEITRNIKMPLLTLTGGQNLRYGDRGWLDNDRSDISFENVVKLNVKEGTKTSLYDPQSGTITANQDGRYKLTYKVQLVNHPPKGASDGSYGLFGAWITINNHSASSKQAKNVYKGFKVPEGITTFDSDGDHIIDLKKGDRLHVRFFTYQIGNMNTDTENIYINKNQSYLVLRRL